MATATSYVSREQPSIEDDAKINNAFYDASTVITLFAPKNFLFAAEECAAAAENMMLAADVLGIGSCYTGQGWLAFDDPYGQEILRAWNIRTDYYAVIHLGTKQSQECLPTAVCYVRPSRYTKALMDKENCFTLSHFPEQYRKALGYLGSHSGRDGDKIKTAGLTPVFADGTVLFAEADLVFVCRKLYSQELTGPGFADQELVEFNYPQRDYHTMYVSEIVKVLCSNEE